ncbi:MAG TPA: nitrogenase-stabilizing/protective protein NifW [Stenomitos sp.]
MTKTLSQFKQLADAEEYFEFFELPFDAQIVNVNRLHILKKFSQYVREIDAHSAELSEEETLSQYCAALQQAYDVFLSSTPLEQKLFKVFNEKPKNVVMLTDINSD